MLNAAAVYDAVLLILVVMPSHVVADGAVAGPVRGGSDQLQCGFMTITAPSAAAQPRGAAG